MNWTTWLIAAAALLLVEMFTPGFLLACLAVGAVGAGAAAALGWSVDCEAWRPKSGQKNPARTVSGSIVRGWC
jgi:membrane protein implicated in regulation of membrane protease activity